MMDGCIYKTANGMCKKYSDDMVVSWCVEGPCADMRPSNADRIRAMTDEEMAEFLDSIIHEHGQGTAEIVGQDCVIEEWLDWLKEGADNDE